MANTAKTSSKLAALIKKTAQKLVKNPKAIHKELKKLALTLPLMALLVEEVRAAQSKISIDAVAAPAEVFEDEAALAEFIDEQNLDEAQYAEIEQELEGVLLAKADQAVEEDDDKGALLERTETGAGRGLAAEAESDAAATAAEHAAADTESFELAGLVIPIAPAPLIGAVAGGLGLVAVTADNAATTAAPKVEPATGSNLAKSLKVLKAEGVNFVQPAAGVTAINVELGDTASLGNTTTGIPLFGDTDQNGTLSDTEDNALSVNLTIDNVDQLAEVAALTASATSLAQLGIDSVTINLAEQSLLTALADDNAVGGYLQSIRDSGLTINTIDMGTNAGSLTDAQADALVANGLSFAADDTTISLQADSGTGTHLSNSLKELQKLGVDSISTASGAGHVSVDFDTASASSASTPFSATGLPQFATGLDVTLNVADTQISQLNSSSAAAALTGANIDHLQVNLLDAEVGSSSAGYANELSSLLGTPNLSNLSAFNATIDLGGSAVDAQVSISQVQAGQLIADGLHFAADDTITLDATLTAGNTHLGTSLKDLNKLGVDAVSVTGADAVNVDLGGLTLADLGTGGALASFDEAMRVTLNVADVAEFGTTAGLASQLHAAHIDNVKLDVLDANTDGDFDDQLIALLGNSSFESAVLALSNPDVAVGVTLDLGGANEAGHLLIHSEQISGFAEHGIGFAANDQIAMDTQMLAGAHSTHLGHTLKDLQKLGVDSVSVVGAVTGDDLHIDFGRPLDTNPLNLATGGLPQFTSNLDVTVHASNGSQLNELGTLANTVGVDLGALGIDHVQLNFGNQAAFDSLFGSAPSLMSTLAATSPVTALAGAVTALTADNVHIDPLDFASNAGHLSDSQAQILLEQGLTFAANDIITLQADAGSTHLSTSLKDLQKLGVDAVAVTGAATGADLHVTLGSADPADFASTVDFADFAAALDVTLDVQSSTAQFGFAADFAAGLHAANIDNVKFDVADAGSDGYLNDLLAFGADQNAVDSVAALKTNMVGIELDLGGSAQVGELFINATQVTQLIAAGVHFSADDHITATGTYATAQMADLQKLGVDTYELAVSSVQMASLSSSLQDAGLDSLDVFDTQQSFDATLLSQLDNFDWTAGTNSLIAPVATAASTDAVSSMVSGGVDVLSAISLDPQATWGDLIETLQDAGLATADVQTSAAVHISDDLSAALYEAGMLHALPDAAIAIDAGVNKVLNTSLKAMADLGVDSVNADHKVYVELGLKPEDGQTIADLHDLFAALGADNTTPTDLFGSNDAGLVLDQTTFDTLGTAGVEQLLGDLSKLGFTEVDVMGATEVSAVYQINVTAQTPVLSQVALIGTDAINDLAHVFDPDILNKPIK